MNTTKVLAIFTLAAATGMAQQSAGLTMDKEAAHLLKLSEAEQKAYVNSAFDHGLPQATVNTVTTLIRERSATLAPVLGDRVVEALKSPKPIDCFVDKTVDPQASIMAAASAIAYAADENALKELAKILAVDDRRFGWLIGYALSDGGSRNFFPVAYKGLEIRSAPLEAKMIAWIDKQIQDDPDAADSQLKTWWADALVERLGHAASATDWANDPLVKKIKPELAQLERDPVLQLSAQEAQRRTEHRPEL